MQEIYNFLKETKIYFLATEDEDKPKVRPFGSIFIYEDKLYINTRKDKKVYEQIQKNPNIEICALKENKWLRISAKAIPDNREKVKKYMLENSMPQIKNTYNIDDIAPLYLKEISAVEYTFSGQRKII